MKKLLMFFSAVLLASLYWGYRHYFKPDAQLIIGYSQEAPYAFVNHHGQPEGLFVTAATEISLSLELQDVDWLMVEFYQLFKNLKLERIRVIGTGITITPQRAAQLCFAEPLLQTSSAFLTLVGSSADLSNTKHGPIAVLAGSVEHKLLQQQGRAVVLAASAREGALMVRDNKATALALTKPTLLALMHEFPQYFVLIADDTMLPDIHLLAFAFRDSDTQFVAKWNAAQRHLREHQGFIEQAQQQGFSLPDLAQQAGRGCYAR